MDKLIVSSAVGPQGLAIYTVSASVANQINSISSLLTHPVIHVISSSESRAKIANFVNLSILTGPILGFVCVLASPAIRSIFLPGLADHNQILLADQSIAIMCLIYGIYSINCYGYYHLIARNKLMDVSAIVMSASVLSIASMAFLGDKLGLLGLVMCNGGFILTCSMTLVSLQGMYSKFVPAILVTVLLSITSILCIVSRHS